MDAVKKPKFEVDTDGGFAFSPKHRGFEFPDDYRSKSRTMTAVWLRPRRARNRLIPAQETIENAVAKMMEQSRSLLDLPDDWDDEGAIRITEETTERVLGIFERALGAVDFKLQSLLLSPRVTALADGSIDVRWKSPGFTLLINVRPKDHSEAKFYGMNNNQQDIRGALNFDAPDFRFLNWLVG